MYKVKLINTYLNHITKCLIMKTTQYEEKMMKNDVTPYDNEVKNIM